MDATTSPRPSKDDGRNGDGQRLEDEHDERKEENNQQRDDESGDDADDNRGNNISDARGHVGSREPVSRISRAVGEAPPARPSNLPAHLPDAVVGCTKLPRAGP